MTDEPIPDDIRRFILTSLESIPQLEALLLLRGNSTVEWDAGGVGKRIYIPEQKAGEILVKLQEAGFIAASSDDACLYHFSPASTAMGRLVDRLAEIYAANLVAVTKLIHEKAGQQVRKFADAFRLRKE